METNSTIVSLEVESGVQTIRLNTFVDFISP